MNLKNLFNRLTGRPVVYGENFFQEQWFTSWNDLSLVLQKILESEPKWKSIVDFGCGPGIMIDRLNDSNIHCVGCDYSPEAHDIYIKRYGNYPDKYKPNLNEIDLSKIDLVISFDVLEHMHDDEIVKLMNDIREVPEVLFNISRNRKIEGHVNIKTDRDWISFILEQGYGFEKQRTEAMRTLYTQLRPGAPDLWDKNLFLFRRLES